MRIHIKMSRTLQPIDFNYQPLLTGCINKWLGENNEQHGRISLYSFSWLQNVDVRNHKIHLKDDTYFTLSFHDIDNIKTVMTNILDSPEMFFGAKVTDICLQDTPDFSGKERFFTASPVLIKRYHENEITHYTYEDEKSDEYLTETLKKKAGIAGLDATGTKVCFDRSYHSPRTKIISYKGIRNRVNICPVIVEGRPEIVAFAWNVGIGNSTGIGFGALK